MRFLLFCFTLFSLLISCAPEPSAVDQEPDATEEKPIKEKKVKIPNATIQAAKSFCKVNGYNQKTAFFTDMSVRSGRKRFFVVNLETGSVKHKGLVTHGHCKNYASRKASFSNEVGSNCTSLGKYKVGYKYDGRFGTAYKLHGLEETNSNAFDRFVVLHSHGCVPNYEATFGICRSEGCPTISPDFLSTLIPIIDNSEKPILLWVYN